jgi:hypothetical protein
MGWTYIKDGEKRKHIEYSWLNPVGKWQRGKTRRIWKGNMTINL